MESPFKSLYLQTEFLFWKYHSIFKEIDGGWIITTPDNPLWHWGNLIVLKEPPRAIDASKWLQLFSENIERKPTGAIMTWDIGELAADEAKSFDEQGLSVSLGAVLTLGTLHRPEHFNDSVQLVEINDNDNDWEEVIQINVDGFGEFFGPTYHRYARWRIGHHRELIERGFGKWYLAKVDGKVAGSLGIYPDDGFCRFQEIVVRKEFQRQGIASTMTHEVARRAGEKWPELTQVIVAESDGNAQRLYRSLGFEQYSISQALQLKEQNPPAPEGL